MSDDLFSMLAVDELQAERAALDLGAVPDHHLTRLAHVEAARKSCGQKPLTADQVREYLEVLAR